MATATKARATKAGQNGADGAGAGLEVQTDTGMHMKVTSAKTEAATIIISAPNIQRLGLHIIGTAPLMQLRMSQKVLNGIREKQEAGSTGRSRTVRTARNFEQDARDALHMSTEGWVGIPAPAFRNGMISACRLVGFKMTLAKLSIFVEADGFDMVDGLPLVKLIAGEPETSIMPVRNATGVLDLRARPMWREWEVDLTVSYDGDQFTARDVINLVNRVGMQVGIGEGRPDSKDSAGLGFGTFRVQQVAGTTEVQP